MEWIFSDGSTFVLLPKRSAAAWNKGGVAQCEEACKKPETFKTLCWQGAEALVLETEGGQMSWVDSKEGGCFVAWVYASPDIPDELVKAQALGLPDVSFEERYAVSLPEQEYILMAASDQYPESASTTLPVSLPPGRYEAGVCREMTFVYNEQPAEFYVVRLKRLPQE